ncbi:MAG TPA: response regulator [Planctomycetota bacterium]|nr:response regulator [Planctomycetota bacterium]
MSGRNTILVVDDTASILNVVAHTLAGAGYRPLTAATAMDAVALARHVRPDLILMDIMMPGLEGSVASGLMRDLEELRDVPVLLMSALPEEDLRERAAEAGATGFLAKPFRKERLLELVGRTLHEAAPQTA